MSPERLVAVLVCSWNRPLWLVRRELDPGRHRLLRVRDMESAGFALRVLVASYVPARRAVAVDPIIALRHE